jgi:hypothetical protein
MYRDIVKCDRIFFFSLYTFSEKVKQKPPLLGCLVLNYNFLSLNANLFDNNPELFLRD